LSILTVERVARNYNNIEDMNKAAGSDVFQTIQKHMLTDKINKFLSTYPDTDNKPIMFVHISKTIAPLGYIPYGDQYFLEISMDKFIQYIAADLTNNPSEDYQLKIAQKLSNTLYHLLKNKSPTMVESNIRTFSKLFTIDPQAIYYILGDSILQEKEGRAQIIAGYRANLNSLFKNAQQKLSVNVSKAINMSGTFVSYPVGTNILVGPSKLVNDSLKSHNVSYPKSCVGKTPVFGMDTHLSEFSEQCLRQWTRTVYCKRFPVKSGDDAIIYLVLLEMMCVQNSTVDVTVKNAFAYLSKVMLNKKRTTTNMTEAEFLIKGNAPSSNSGDHKEFISIMISIMQMLNIVGDPMSVWLSVVTTLDSLLPGILDAQEPHCTHNNFTYPKYTQDTISSSSIYDFTCYLTKTGGYVFVPHESPLRSQCSPIFMLSKQGMADVISHNNMICPVCYAHLNDKSYEFIGPAVESKIPLIFLEDEKVHDDTNAYINDVQPVDCYLIMLRGTVGSGKSTMSEFIRLKYTNLGYKVYVEGTDKYCKSGIAADKAVKYVQRELNTAVRNKNKTIIIIDTCGESRSPTPFNVSFNGWKTINLTPNLSHDNILGYLAWSLTNVLSRGRSDTTTSFHLSPYSKPSMEEGIQLCKDVHKKKAVALGLYDHAFSKLSDANRISLANDYAKTLKECDFSL
jgi:hypothetical protein